MEQLEHPAVTYMRSNGEPPLEVIGVADGICMTVEIDAETYAALTQKDTEDK